MRKMRLMLLIVFLLISLALIFMRLSGNRISHGVRTNTVSKIDREDYRILRLSGNRISHGMRTIMVSMIDREDYREEVVLLKEGYFTFDELAGTRKPSMYECRRLSVPAYAIKNKSIISCCQKYTVTDLCFVYGQDEGSGIFYKLSGFRTSEIADFIDIEIDVKQEPLHFQSINSIADLYFLSKNNKGDNKVHILSARELSAAGCEARGYEISSYRNADTVEVILYMPWEKNAYYKLGILLDKQGNVLIIRGSESEAATIKGACNEVLWDKKWLNNFKRARGRRNKDMKRINMGDLE